MTRLMWASIAVASALSACGGGPAPTATGTPTKSGAPSPSPTRSAAPASPVSTIAFVTSNTWGREADVFGQAGNDLWSYDVKTDALTRLTFDGDATIEEAPAIRSATEVTFAVAGPARETKRLSAPSTVYSVKTGGSTQPEPVELFEADGRVTSQAWSPDGNTLAFIAWVDKGDSAPALYVYESKRVRKVKQMDLVQGREFYEGDESRVSWSADGTMIVAADSAAGSETPNLLIVQRDGMRVSSSLRGSFARLAGDGETLVAQSAEDSTWFAMSLESGARRALAIPSRRALPQLSPDSTRIAFSDWSAKSKVYVYDLATKTTTQVATNGAAPIWLDDDTIAYSVVEACSVRHTEEDLCVQESKWTATGAVHSVGADGSGDRAISLSTTIGVSVL